MNFQQTPIAKVFEKAGNQPRNALGAAMARPGGSSADKPREAAEAPPRRARLADLNVHIHCSIIGTCLGTAELRKLLPRFRELDRERATDLEIHHAAVELAGEGGAGAKALHKALDDRHAVTIRKFREAKDAGALNDAWLGYLASGDIPGAYWALMTHPFVTTEIRNAAFGEVHMLSHLVGAANRADIRRLLALEQENAELKDKVDRQQQRLQEANARHQNELQLARDALLVPGRVETSAAPAAGVVELNSALAAKDRALAHQAKRRELAEQALEEQLELTRGLNERLAHARALAESLGTELEAMEAAYARRLESSDAESAAHGFLLGKRVVYVGGRPAPNRAIKSLVESAGGELQLHDGGMEDKRGLFAAALPSADFVVFPVDCINHDAMSNLKKLCERHQVPFHALRSASIASFSALVAKLATPAPETAAAPLSHFCLRHG